MLLFEMFTHIVFIFIDFTAKAEYVWGPRQIERVNI